MRETWYVLENGAFADPNDVAPDDKGALRHKGGVAVAMRGDVPCTRSVDPDEERQKAAPKAREMKAEEPKRTYKTRESKAD